MAETEDIERIASHIQVNTQSSIRIEADGKVLYSDPFKIPKAVNDADVIFLTHDHYDHFSPEDIRKVMKAESVFVAPEKMAGQVSKFVSSDDRMIRVLPGMKTDVAGIPVETVPAFNLAKPFHPKKNGWTGYVVTVDGVRIYLAGDTDATKEAAAVRCDIAMVPIGGTFTMDARQAAKLVNEIRPWVAIPIHYGSIVGRREDADVFRKYVEPEIKIVMKL
ncbi:MAG: MBL fold metallo-hydrolase [Lachnospiraceae bacterium]|jgi:L-ascorbate metabolism protein UlaG (beta-lactamase superfamily)|nr:MBL fold metallo-hydrolase [Lachnospiraceae bacterium]MCH4030876.1 MBL fold metallo-hydrolase [Lachnospiraceae bacterium]MCH4070850.1 MBL fold metallo-hydrolase [Lachnospiraceae bacterium]MCH4106976.1 MBL fold metallo-hydrolase [Lachnospiraceae bacterium]MCI1302170.1 MBL fold metallo-hydrolase [Lachnospiraceae bacterium]